jgi:uncharacterized protein YbjT (DUF2867 family)
MKKILFIGATGMLGKPVALELLRAGFNLTLLGRDTEKLKRLFPNIPVIKGNIFDMESLDTAMADQEIVYCNLSVAQSSKKNEPQPEREGITNIIEAAKRADVKRLGYLSSLIKNYQGMNGFNWWSFDLKQSAVDRIKNSGLLYNVFYPSTFMETLNQQMMQGNRIILAGRSEYPMWFIAAKDYGMQVAWALKKAGENSQEYPIQGPEPLTFDEASGIFIQNYKKANLKIIRTPLSPLKFLGMFNQKFNYGANIIEALNKYPEKFESEKTWQDLGKPNTTLAQYAASL